MAKKEYNRENVVSYAYRWAYARNKKYYNFDLIGGDCTNFASQCIYAGSNIMNYDKIKGWYYNSVNDRSPSWTGVEFLYKFLTTNKGVGPYGREVAQYEIQLGDVIQLSFDNSSYTHNLVVVNIGDVNDLSQIRVAAHTYDTYNKAVSNYQFRKLRFIHIDGVRD